MSKIIITGVSGQDGSYMADYLLANTDHEIYGMVRRSAKPDYGNLDSALQNPRFKLVTGDLSDANSIETLVREIQPAYFFNFAAQSFVGASWQIPEQTFDVTATGVLRILEAIRKHAPECRFYSAGSSEEMGDVQYTPQDINHPIRPRSPYGAAKAAARHITKVYRESYNLYAIHGILYNHECLTSNTPLILLNKNNGLIDIKPISEIVPHRKNPLKSKKYTSIIPCKYMIWDGDKWASIKTRTATWNDENNDKKVIKVACRGGYYEATSNHRSIKQGNIETKTSELKIGDNLELKTLPELTNKSLVLNEYAELLGLLTAEGYVNPDSNSARFTNTDISLCNRVKELWHKLSVGSVSEYTSKSSFTGIENIHNVNLIGDSDLCRKLRRELYTENGFKKVPQIILNSNLDIIKVYLQAYNLGDGTKAGNQKTEFKRFTTNSQVLACGLWYLLEKLNLRVISCPEFRNDVTYFCLNINSPQSSNKGKHLLKDINAITKLQKLDYNGWLFDLETDSNTFSAGVGFTWVHNSERRGEEFVTRKITKGVARIYDAIQKGQSFSPIELGNLDAKRDWSHSLDFVEGIWLMMNQPLLITTDGVEHPLGTICGSLYNDFKPREYILSSNETHSIREFVEKAFAAAGIKGVWRNIGNGPFKPEDEVFMLNTNVAIVEPDDKNILVKINPKFYRPAEVDLLLGDSTPARKELGWKPKISFDDLVKGMVQNDIDIIRNNR